MQDFSVLRSSLFVRSFVCSFVCLWCAGPKTLGWSLKRNSAMRDESVSMKGKTKKRTGIFMENTHQKEREIEICTEALSETVTQQSFGKKKKQENTEKINTCYFCRGQEKMEQKKIYYSYSIFIHIIGMFSHRVWNLKSKKNPHLINKCFYDPQQYLCGSLRGCSPPPHMCCVLYIVQK